MEARMNLLPSTNDANHGCIQGDRDNTGDTETLFEHTESQFKQLFNTKSCFYARCPMSPEQKANTIRQCSDLLFARTNSNQSQVDDDDDDISAELERVTMNGINEYATGDISRLDVAFCGYLTKLVENFKKDSHWDPLFPPKEVNWVDLKASTGSSNVILLFHFFNEASKREEFVHHRARQNFISVISNRLQNDVRSWIVKQVKSAMTIGKEPVLQRTKLFVEKLNTADELLQPKQSVVSFFEPLGIDYYRIASTEIDIVVADKARHLIEDMDAYQTKHQKFKVNIRETTELSIKHFFALRSIRSTILRKFSEKELFRVSLFMFEEWFSSAVTFWLGTFRYECFDARKNAIQMEKNVVKMISSAHTSSEYLISIFSKMTSEWQEIRLKDADMQLLGAMKITDTICDCVKEYLESVSIIESNKSSANKRYEVPERVAFISVCLINLSNLRSYVKELCLTLKWELVAKSISMKHENVLIGKTVLQSLRTMVASTEEEMGRFANNYATRISEELSEEMKFLISSFATNPTEKTLNSLLEMFEKKLFSGLRKKLENLTKSECLVEMWQAQMAMLEESVEIGRPIGYYQEIQKHLGVLKTFFNKNGLTLVKIDYCKAYLSLLNWLELNSRSSEELILQYYKSLTEIKQSRMDYGKLTVQVGHRRDMDGRVRVDVNVIKGESLPEMTKRSLSNPYVSVSLSPSSLFDCSSMPCQTPTKFSTVNPEYNHPFIFDVDETSLSKDGAVIIFSVWHHDIILPDDFLGEAILPLSSVRCLKSSQNIDELPVHILRLRFPKEPKNGSFKVVKVRAEKGDKISQGFMTERSRTFKVKCRLCKPVKSIVSTITGKKMEVIGRQGSLMTI